MSGILLVLDMAVVSAVVEERMGVPCLVLT